MKHTKESKEKIANSLIGRIGSQSRRWKGEDASYAAKHMWILKHYKKPEKCQSCGTTEYSRLEWANISGTYKRDISDYIALCPSCHREYDKKTHCKHGHEYTPDNTYYNTRGHRQCMICMKEQRRKRKNGTNN